MSSLDAPNDGFVRGRIPPPGFGGRASCAERAFDREGKVRFSGENLTPSAGISEVKMGFRRCGAESRIPTGVSNRE